MLEVENQVTQGGQLNISRNFIQAAKWMPQAYTKPNSTRSRGDDVIDFMETFMTVPTGKFAGTRIRLAAWQKWLLRLIFEEDENGVLRYQTFLLGIARKNGKSLLVTGIGLYFLAMGGPGHQIIVCASTAEQAEIIAGEAKKQVLNSTYLSKLIKPYKNMLVNKMNGSTFKTVPADGETVTGLGGSVILCDEVGSWEKHSRQHALNLWGSLGTSRANREESIMIGLSTAAPNKDNTLLGSLYKRLLKISADDSEANRMSSFGGAWWAVPDDANPLDESLWYLANPNIVEGLLYVEKLRETLEEMQSQSNTGFFFRMHLNMWVKVEGESFLSTFHWNNAARPEGVIEYGEKVTAGFDGSLNADSTVLVIMSYTTGNFKIFREWVNDGTEGWTVTREQVEAALEDLMSNYDVLEVWFDRSHWDREVADWQMRWRDKITAIPQTRQRITPMATMFSRDISEGRIFHNDDSKLTAYVMAAVLTEDGGYSKSKVKGAMHRIDGLVASVLANGARNLHQINAEKRKKIEPAQMAVF